MTDGAIQVREEPPAALGEVPVVMVCEDLLRGRRQETDERGHSLDFLEGDFRIRRWVSVRRDRSAVDGFLDGRKRRRHAHFLRKCPGVEIMQSSDRRLATEPPHPTINRAIGASGDPVTVGTVPTFVSENGCLGYSVHQSETKQRGRGAPPLAGGVRWD